VTAIIDTREDGAPGAWRGRAASEPVTITVRPEPTPLTAAQQSRKYRLFVRYHLARGNVLEAMGQVDEWLKHQPRDPSGLELRGDLFARSGKTEEALKDYNSALDAFLKKHGTKGEPPSLLLRKRNEQMNKLFGFKQ
jgi:hypothetical protein